MMRCAMGLALAVGLAAACDDDIRVLGREETAETEPPVGELPTGSGGEMPTPPPFVPCASAMQDPTNVCVCPGYSACYCESPGDPCMVECPDGFCDIQCAYASVYCNASCPEGCSLFCPEGAYCSLACDGGCSALCMPGSYCEVRGSDASPSSIYCEVDASCICLGGPDACTCHGPGDCQTVM